MGTDNLDLTGPICRACLKLGANKNIFSIHKASCEQYSYIFFSCFSLKAEPEDGLPQHLCRICLNKLINFYKFKNTVTQNDLKLQQILKDRISEIPSEGVDTKLHCDKSVVGGQSDFSKHDEPDNGDYFFTANTLDAKNVVKIELKHEQIEDTKAQIYFDDTDDNFEDFNDDCEKSTDKLLGKIIKKTHQCDICGKILSCKSNLKQHVRKHTGERPYSCDVCEKKFYKAEHVVIHKRTHTGERPHHCTICPKKFIQYAALKAHLRTHSGERPHMCSVCGKSFSQSSSLAYHLRTHSGETPFTCKQCGKGFKNAGNLNIHKRFHDNERRFACSICEKKFVTSSHLNVHVKQHNGDKSHQCIICGKAFVRSEHLKGHLIIHTGQKPHECKLCPKKYTQSSHLNRHMKTHKAGT